MEHLLHNSAATSSDDDEDYSMFGKKRSRIKRRAISDEDDDEKENNRVVDNIAVEKIVGALENGVACVVMDTVNSMGSKQAGMNKMIGLSGGLVDSDDDGDVNPSDDNTGSPSDDDCNGKPHHVGGASEAVVRGLGMAQKLFTDCERNSGVKFDSTSDIFDAEISDEEDCPSESSDENTCLTELSDDVRGNRTGDHFVADHTDDSRHDNDSNDGLDESQVDPKLLAKLKKMKGASRSGHKRKAKTSAEDRMEAYSQSQRMLRDSRVSIPYYEPEPKLLDDFLARANQKRLAYAGLNQAKDIQKAQIICDKLSSPSIVATALRQRASTSNKDEGSARSLSSNVKHDQSDDVCAASHLSLQQGVSLPQKCSIGTVENSENELPDLQPPLSDTSEDKSSKTIVTCDSRSQEVHIMRLAAESSQELETEVCVPSLQTDNKPHYSPDKIEHTISLFPHGQSQTLGQAKVSTSESAVCSDSQTDVSVCDSPTDNLVRCPSPPVSSSACPTASVSEAPISKTLTSNLLDRRPDLHLPALPSLRGSPDGIICLDDDQIEPAIRKPGLVKLMSRLVQHSSKDVSTTAHIQAPSNLNGNNQTLVADSVVEAEIDKCPGSKLDRLKQQLGVGMRKKRAEARHRRLQLFALENEEGFEKGAGEEGSNFDDEETEMTEESDTDDEEEEDDEVDYKLKLNIGGSDDDNDYNPFIDNEASEEDENSNPDVHLHFDVSEEEEEEAQFNDGTDGEKDLQNSDMKRNKGDIHFEQDKTERGACVKRKQKKLSHLESDEDETSTHEPEYDTAVASSTSSFKNAGLTNNERKWSCEMTPMSKLLLDTQQQSRFRSKNSQSPDLYSTGVVDESESSHGRATDHPADSLYRSQSENFDFEGILKLVQTQPRTKTSTLALCDDEGDKDFGSHLSMTAGQIFRDLASQPASTGSCLPGSDEDNMKQLLGLCSGTFGPIGENIQGSQSSIERSTQSFPVSQSFKDDEVYDPFHVLSESEDDDASNRPVKRAVLSDSEDDFDGDDAATVKEDDDPATDKEGDESATDNEGDESATDDEDKECSDDKDHDTETTFRSAKFTDLKKKGKKYIRNEFVEEEAELSGSEYESDENLDLAEEDDILEVEEGDLDLQGMSENRLRNQVGKLHMKQLQDDDERQVMRFKEMYLQDGDLYSEGAGRRRNFRWKDIEHSSDPDLFGQHSDDEQAEDDEDVLWRRNRFERERLVEEEDFKSQAENSQVLKLGQFFVKKQESILHARDQVSVTPTVQSTQDKSLQSKAHKKGSFLSRGKETLVRLAQMVKATRTGNTGKNSRNFVFQTVGGPDADEEKTETPQPAPLGNKRKAHIAATTQQTCKKPKLVSTTTVPHGDNTLRPQLKQQCSIFELIEPM